MPRWAVPRCAIQCVGRGIASTPPTLLDPRQAPVKPMMTCKVVRRRAPLRPNKVKISPGCTVKTTSRRVCDLPFQSCTCVSSSAAVIGVFPAARHRHPMQAAITPRSGATRHNCLRPAWRHAAACRCGRTGQPRPIYCARPSAPCLPAPPFCSGRHPVHVRRPGRELNRADDAHARHPGRRHAHDVSAKIAPNTWRPTTPLPDTPAGHPCRRHRSALPGRGCRRTR
jgi:hypothetical protein